MRVLTVATGALLLANVFALSATPPAAGAAGVGDAVTYRSTAGKAGGGASASPCSDGKYRYLPPSGTRWRSTLSWSFRSSSVPAGLSPSAVLGVIQRAFANVTGERNDCGRPDTVSATSSYAGSTSRKPAVTAAGQCGSPDGHSVIGFAPLNGYYAGYTCIWWQNSTIIEADMRLGSNTAWATGSSCSNSLMMEALVTHEVGHAFGLAHVGEANHGRLTMSTYIDGLCENQEATLGLGDMKGLEAIY